MNVDFNEENLLANRYDLSTTEGQLSLLFGPGLGFYPDPANLVDIARMLETRFAKKGYDPDTCDIYVIYPEIMEILREASQLSFNKVEGE
jgi:hypothetical protein